MSLDKVTKIASKLACYVGAFHNTWAKPEHLYEATLLTLEGGKVLESELSGKGTTSEKAIEALYKKLLEIIAE